MISEYQNLGIASQLGILFLNATQKLAAQTHTKIKVIWDAWEFNIPSLKVAEKSGFSTKSVYPAMYGFWNN